MAEEAREIFERTHDTERLISSITLLGEKPR